MNSARRIAFSSITLHSVDPARIDTGFLQPQYLVDCFKQGSREHNPRYHLR